jgi:tyrosinase
LLKRPLREARVETVDNFIRERNKSTFNFNEKDAPDKLIIELENVKVEKIPEGVVEVYLNLPAKERPTPKSKSFVGLLDLFSISHANMHPNMRGMENETRIELNASKAAKALKLTIADLKRAEISFYVRGNTVRGKEVTTASDIRATGMNLAIEMAEK